MRILHATPATLQPFLFLQPKQQQPDCRDFGSNQDRIQALQQENNPAENQNLQQDPQPVYLYGSACDMDLTEATANTYGFSSGKTYTVDFGLKELDIWGGQLKLGAELKDENKATKTDKIEKDGAKATGKGVVSFRLKWPQTDSDKVHLTLANNGALALMRLAASAFVAHSKAGANTPLDIFCRLEIGGATELEDSRKNGYFEAASLSKLDTRLESSIHALSTAVSAAVGSRVGNGWPMGRQSGHFPDRFLNDSYRGSGSSRSPRNLDSIASTLDTELGRVLAGTRQQCDLYFQGVPPERFVFEKDWQQYRQRRWRRI
jgi:hypothetical protein